jgi:lipopolysaccharide transport system ATP-binding protein
MSQPIVVFDGVWKKFARGKRHSSLRDFIPSLVGRFSNRRRRAELASREFWALEDVSFRVGEGEALGIIGPNGAGKSTALKLLTRIMKPTKGQARIVGRAGSLIEIAAGFHPDLTGRENVYLQGAVMGMRRSEITRRFDEIVDFAGVGDFLDTAVKRYSSGMNARLGFSIAAHLDPVALIIDEVLSVGDSAFQQKCVSRMRDFKRQGVAIVFVSHNLQAVEDLCDRVLYLRRKTQAFGPPGPVLERYLRDTMPAAENADSPIDIHEAKLTDTAEAAVESVTPGSELRLRVRISPRVKISNYHVCLSIIRSTDGLSAYDGSWTGGELGASELQPDSPVEFEFCFRAHLTRGHYFAAWQLSKTSTNTVLAMVRPAAFFAVDEQRTWAGVADVAATVKVRQNGSLA